MEQQDDQPEAASLPPPQAPRPLTPTARRRSWSEPRVRFWWAAALVLLVIAGYIGARQMAVWLRERALIREGAPLQATVEEAGGMSLPGQTAPPDARVVLRYELDGREYRVHGVLPDWDEFIVTGSEIPIRVNPLNPRIWTARTEPTSLVRPLIGPLILLPIILAALAAALLARRNVLRTWQEGEAREAVVSETRQSAIAPLSRAARCTLKGSPDRRVFTVFVPRRQTDVHPGQTLWVIHPPNRPDRAIAAAPFSSS